MPTIPSTLKVPPSKRAYLWRLVYDNPDNTYKQFNGKKAREIQTVSNDIAAKKDSKTSSVNSYIMIPHTQGGIVDVVNDYAWTNSPKEARDAVPYIIMKEYHQKRGADLQKLIYHATVVGDVLKSTVESFGINDANINEAKTTVVKKAQEGVSKLNGMISSKVPSISSITSNVTTKVNAAIEKYKEDINKDYNQLVSHRHLAPYDMLYACNETGWQYKLPLFTDDFAKSQQNTYGDSKNSLFGSFLDSAKTLSELPAGLLNTYRSTENNVETNIETPKSYVFSDQNPTLTIKFPLFNTSDIENAYKNYDLIQLLKYQSRPYRVDKTAIIPTHIYEIAIPGFKYLPYAYIQNVDIEHKGIRRILPITICGENNEQKDITFVCPEAYEVTLTIQSLTNDTQNFMVEYMFNDRKLLPTTKQPILK